MSALPTVFISHGSPMHALHAGAAGVAWRSLGARLPRPRAVLVVSAHWETALPMVSTATRPETIHDFGGFPQELYRLRYPATGAPEVATRVLALLEQAGLLGTADGSRGLDHGAWVPLRYMYPAADVPVLQLSVQPSLGAAHHLQMGAALTALAEEDVLVLGSGHMTHNLREWSQFVRQHGVEPAATAIAPYVEQFRQWVDAKLRADAIEALAHYRERAPQAQRAHPTDEHFLPLLTAFAAAGPRSTVERIDLGVDAGVLAMDAYLFTPQ